MRFKSSLLFITYMLFATVANALPVDTILLTDFEGLAPTVAGITASNSSASGQASSAASVEYDGDSSRLKMTDPGGFRNGIVVTLPNVFPEPGFYLITSEVKVDNTGAALIYTFGMGAKVGLPTTARVDDANAGYIMNLENHPTSGASLGFQTIGAGIQVPAGGSFPKALSLYFSTDPSGAPSDSHADFISSHRGNDNSWPTSTNSSAVYIDNIKCIGPGNFGEERHAWISIGDNIPNLPTLETRINEAHANNFNCIDILVRYRANRLYVSNRDFSTYTNNEPALSGVNPSNDPLQFAIDRAHELGMRVYASVSCFLVADGTSSYPSVMPSGSITYVYNGGNPRPQTSADSGNEGLWADPGREDVRTHTLNVTMDIVQNYDLDGVIFDRMRYQGDQFGYNPIALNQMGYGSTPPSPNSSVFDRRRQEAAATYLHDAYVSITNLKPWMIVGTVPIAYGVGMNDTYNYVFQSWPTWTAFPTQNRTISFGSEDLIQPQFYRQWNSGGPGGVYNAPEANEVLMVKSVYGDLASDPMDFGLMPGANTNVAPLFATLSIDNATDAVNTADALADNICDTQTDSFHMNGSGIFSVTRLLDSSYGFGSTMIARIRNSSTACGPDVMSPAAPLSDFLMKKGWDNTPPLTVSGASITGHGTYASLNWTAPALAVDGESASRYLIYRSTSSNVKPYYENQTAITQTITNTSFTDGAVSIGGNYWYRIVPVDDFNNKGPSTVIGPVSLTSANVILESRQSNGDVTPAASYDESPAMANTTSKSTAPGLNASGARYSTNTGMVATFKPALSVPGTYNIFVTMGSGSNNNANATYAIDGASSYITGNVDLSFSNSALVNNWLQLESNVYFDLSVQPSIAFTNVDGNAGIGHRFVMDAVKFELVAENTETKDWQIY